jgi:glycosyltransferase involved in cell wall biosynthesis
MKLLYVIPEYPPYAGGGIVTFYADLLPRLAKMGHDVTVLVANPFSEPCASDSAGDGVRVEFVGNDRIARVLERLPHFAEVPTLQRHLATAWAAWDSIGDHDAFDIVETSDWGLLFVPWILSRPKPAVVVQSHGSVGQIAAAEHEPGTEIGGLLTQLIEKDLIAAADDVQTYSALNAARWQSVLDREVTCIAPGWSAPVAGDGRANGPGVVVGRIQEWKGPIVLCEAVRRIGANAPEIQWIGRDTRFLARRMSMAKFLADAYPDVWGKKIVPVGLRTPPETAERQRRAAFAVVPSTWDVFNFTVAEAMGAGRPVICSDGAGAAGLIENGVNGFRVPAGDVAALADSIQRMHALTGDARDAMGQRARDTVERALDPARIAAERVNRYEQVAQQSTNRRRTVSPLVASLSPGGNGTSRFDFLNQFAMSDLTRYLRSRLLDKFFDR